MNQIPNETTQVVSEDILIKITATKVTDEDQRMEFLPKHYGQYFISFEHNTYALMSHMNSTYTGGCWDFIELSNGAGFMSLRSDEVCKITVIGNYFSGEMSAEAASIVVALFNLSAAGEQTEDDRFWNEFRKLRDYALEHAEVEAILRAID